MILTLSANEVRKMYQIQNTHTGKTVVLNNDCMNHIFSAMEDYQEKYLSVGYIDEETRKEWLVEINHTLDLLGKV